MRVSVNTEIESALVTEYEIRNGEQSARAREGKKYSLFSSRAKDERKRERENRKKRREGKKNSRELDEAAELTMSCITSGAGGSGCSMLPVGALGEDVSRGWPPPKKSQSSVHI